MGDVPLKPARLKGHQGTAYKKDKTKLKKQNKKKTPRQKIRRKKESSRTYTAADAGRAQKKNRYQGRLLEALLKR